MSVKRFYGKSGENIWIEFDKGGNIVGFVWAVFDKNRGIALKLQRKATVKNPSGLHARPATLIVQFLKNSQSSVTFTYRKEIVDARSLMGILMLAVKPNTQVLITVNGEDAKATMAKLVEMFQTQFGEETSKGS
jgi:phosphocarrier protein